LRRQQGPETLLLCPKAVDVRPNNALMTYKKCYKFFLGIRSLVSYWRRTIGFFILYYSEKRNGKNSKSW